MWPAAMLTSIQSAGVAPEVNLRNSWHAGNKACKRGIHSGFKTQGRHHQKSKTGVSVAPQKGLMFSKIEKKKERKRIIPHTFISRSKKAGFSRGISENCWSDTGVANNCHSSPQVGKWLKSEARAYSCSRTNTDDEQLCLSYFLTKIMKNG